MAVKVKKIRKIPVRTVKSGVMFAVMTYFYRRYGFRYGIMQV